MTSLSSIQVEIVGQSWWEQAAPYLAIVISLLSIGLTLWLRHSDGARLSLKARLALPMGSTDKSPWIQLEATNKGRIGTSITSLGFEAADGRVLAMVSPPHPLTTLLPARLDPGEPARLYLPIREVVETCAAASIDPGELWIAGECGHGRTRKRPQENIRKLLREYLAEI